MKTISEFGHYYSVTFEDGRIAEAVEIMGGWQNLCAMTTKEIKIRRKEFLSIYQALNPEKNKKLVGLIEHEIIKRVCLL
jgi:hypothetical protein